MDGHHPALSLRHPKHLAEYVLLPLVAGRMLRATVQSNLSDEPRRRNELKQQIGFGVPFAGVNIPTALRPLPVLRPRLWRGRDRDRSYPLALTLCNKSSRIAMQIDMAVKIKSPNGSDRLHGFTTTPLRLFPTSSIPRRKTPTSSAWLVFSQ